MSIVGVAYRVCNLWGFLTGIGAQLADLLLMRVPKSDARLRPGGRCDVGVRRRCQEERRG